MVCRLLELPSLDAAWEWAKMSGCFLRYVEVRPIAVEMEPHVTVFSQRPPQEIPSSRCRSVLVQNLFFRRQLC